MLRFPILFIGLSLFAITMTVGCGPTEPPPVASRPSSPKVAGGDEGGPGTPATPTGSKAGMFGAVGEDGLGVGGGGDTDASESEPEFKEINGQMRRLPVASAGGGPAISKTKTKASGGSTAAGMANGLFPVMSGGAGGGSNQTIVSGFGALFPTAGGSVAGGSPSTGPSRLATSTDAKKAEVKPAPKVETFLDRAAKSFEQGNLPDGHRALYAHMLLEKDAFEQFPLQSYKQVDEPRLFLNWGIGVHFTAPSDFSGIPPLIGDAVNDPAARPPGGSDDLGANPGQPVSGPTTSSSKYGKVNTEVPAGMILFYGGDYAERLYKRLNDRRVNEYFGKIIAGMPERGSSTNEGGSVAARAPVNAPVDPMAGRNRPVASTGGETVTGPPTEVGGRGGDAKGDDARGKAGAAKSKSSVPLVQRWSVSTDAKQPGNVTGMLLPGMLSVGEGNVESLVDRAKKLGLDVVVILDVKVTKDKRQFISANVIRLFDTDDSKKVLVQSRSLKNNVVAKDREKTRESNDPVELELDKVFKEFVDVNLKAQALDGWDGNRAAKYVDSLVEKKVDKFRAATETLGLFRMGLLPADKCKSALDAIMDNSGTLLMAGKDSDKKAFLDDLLRSGGGADDSNVR